MSTSEPTDPWEKIRQCGIGFSELMWVRDNLPTHLNEAWKIFEKVTTKRDLAGVIRDFPTLRERCWPQYAKQATPRDLVGLLEYVDEAWIPFQQRASNDEITQAMYTLYPTSKRKCWEILKGRSPSADDLRNAFIATTQLEHRNFVAELSREIWRVWRPLASQSDLMLVMRKHLWETEEMLGEAWDALKPTASTESLCKVIIEYPSLRSEATELFFDRDPTTEDLVQLILYFPIEERVVRRWLRRKTERVVSPIVRRALEKLLTQDASLEQLVPLTSRVEPDQELAAKLSARIALLREPSTSPTIRLLEQLRDEETT